MKHNDKNRGLLTVLRSSTEQRHTVNELYWKRATERLRCEQDINISGKYRNGGIVV